MITLLKSWSLYFREAKPSIKMAAGPVSERNQDATIYVGGLDEKVNEALLWELFVQAGPVVNVHMPKDRVTMQHQGELIKCLSLASIKTYYLTHCLSGYGFVEFLSEDDADYSIKIMNMIKLFGKPVTANVALSDICQTLSLRLE